ncbi:hypothetical protein [Lacticaseibacillus saniviri]|nr:hypothetical protein [Lacticaseibacillus saniviri]MCG4281467.1 hypothetical protein [Lacticaseibacillus saniviri]
MGTMTSSGYAFFQDHYGREASFLIYQRDPKVLAPGENMARLTGQNISYQEGLKADGEALNLEHLVVLLNPAAKPKKRVVVADEQPFQAYHRTTSTHRGLRYLAHYYQLPVSGERPLTLHGGLATSLFPQISNTMATDVLPELNEQRASVERLWQLVEEMLSYNPAQGKDKFLDVVFMIPRSANPVVHAVKQQFVNRMTDTDFAQQYPTAAQYRDAIRNFSIALHPSTQAHKTLEEYYQKTIRLQPSQVPELVEE